MAEKQKLNFDGVPEDVLCITDKHGDTVCYTQDGRFVKFPKGTKLDVQVKKHNKDNSDVPMMAGEVEVHPDEQALNDWIKK
jgi:phage gp45-like